MQVAALPRKLAETAIPLRSGFLGIASPDMRELLRHYL